MDRLDMRRAINHWKAHGLTYSPCCRRGRGDGVPFTDPGSRHRQGADNKADRARRTGIGRKGEKVRLISTSRTSTVRSAPCSPAASPKVPGSPACRKTRSRSTPRATAGNRSVPWLAHGVTIEIWLAKANDVGKGSSGGRLVILSPAECQIDRAEEQHHRRQPVLYGAIPG